MSPFRYDRRMDYGQLLIYDGTFSLLIKPLFKNKSFERITNSSIPTDNGHVRRLLALLRRPPNAFLGNRSLVLSRRQRSPGRRICWIQRSDRTLPNGLGVLAIHNVDIHPQNKHRLCAYLPRCLYGLFHSGRRVLEGQHRGLRHGDETAEGMLFYSFEGRLRLM